MAWLSQIESLMHSPTAFVTIQVAPQHRGHWQRPWRHNPDLARKRARGIYFFSVGNSA
jgi:hypothetical protein